MYGNTEQRSNRLVVRFRISSYNTLCNQDGNGRRKKGVRHLVAVVAVIPFYRLLITVIFTLVKRT